MQYLNDIIKATISFDNKEISIQDWVSIVLGEEWCNVYSDEYSRRAEKFFSLFINKLSKIEKDNLTENDLNNIIEREFNLKREKEKIRQERTQAAEMYRWQARNELYQEKIIEAISNLKPMEINLSDNLGLPPHTLTSNGNTALLCLSDFHAGSTFEVKGFHGEIINKYDFEIMKERLCRLANNIINDNFNCENMVIAILGDAFENVLRLSSLAKLREPVLDTVIKFSEFISQWISGIQKLMNTPIKVVCVGGNHDIQRLLGEKPSLEDENLMKIVVEFLKLRLKNIPNIEVANYTDVAIENIRGTSIMFQHGEDKDLTTTINYFENLYGIKIDEIYAGHFHSPENKSIGFSALGDRQINRVGSICGVDTFAKKVRCASRPSAYIALYSEDGKGWNKTIYL